MGVIPIVTWLGTGGKTGCVSWNGQERRDVHPEEMGFVERGAGVASTIEDDGAPTV